MDNGAPGGSDGAGEGAKPERVKVAIKCLRRSEHVCKTGRHELRTLELVNSDAAGADSHCIPLLDHFSTPDGHLLLVFPRHDQNLRMVLQASAGPGGLPLRDVRTYGRQALLALRCLCKLNLVHNDIKLDNFLLTQKKSRWSNAVRKATVTLCDFGNASRPQSTVETPYIMARSAPSIHIGRHWQTW